jgi:hypothetical protein
VHPDNTVIDAISTTIDKPVVRNIRISGKSRFSVYSGRYYMEGGVIVPNCLQRYSTSSPPLAAKLDIILGFPSALFHTPSQYLRRTYPLILQSAAPPTISHLQYTCGS